MKLYKVLGDNGACLYAKGKSWPLPTDKPTEYLTVEGELNMCKNGLHFATEKSLLTWLDKASIICEAEAVIEDKDKDFLIHGDQAICRQARLTKVLNWSPLHGRFFVLTCMSQMIDTLGDRLDLESASMITKFIDRGYALTNSELLRETVRDLDAELLKVTNNQLVPYLKGALWALTRDHFSAATASLIGAYCHGLHWQDVSVGMWEHRDWQNRKLFDILAA